MGSISTLHPRIADVMHASGLDLDRLYSHQVRGIEALLRGGGGGGAHLCLATATASGKSLVYALYALHVLLESHTHRALFIFPTKALAQDQLRAMRALAATVTLCDADGLLRPIQVH